MSHPPIDQQITFIYTRDLVTSAQFYEKVMGLALWIDQGSCRIYNTSGNAYIGICQTGESTKGSPQPKQQSHIILTIVTQQVDEWYQHLQSQNIHLEMTPATNPKYNIYHFFLRDPDGYLIEIQRFLP